MYDLSLQLVVSIVTGLVVSVITVVLTVHLSLRRFYSEKWWERKAEAYSRIVECLYLVQRNAEAMLNALETGQELTDDKHDRLAGEAREASSEIEKVTSIGAFIISDSAAHSLANLHKSLQEAQKEPSLYGYVDSELAAIKLALAELREIVRKELKQR